MRAQSGWFRKSRGEEFVRVELIDFDKRRIEKVKSVAATLTSSSESDAEKHD